ncbi:MAG: prepilin-type N-terminal cleavage/methylation domain-containing protein [Candidatus Eremiobacteraeota bacterium]|nr:prepilin-type N-terminal cleavage/methylation domain-containing protein [Candidatus Eremiobacteraeota bacterium]
MKPLRSLTQGHAGGFSLAEVLIALLILSALSVIIIGAIPHGLQPQGDVLAPL